MVMPDIHPGGGVWQEELTLTGEDLLLILCNTYMILHPAGNARKKCAVINSTL